MSSISPIDPDALLAETAFVRRLARSLVRDSDLADDVAQQALIAGLEQRDPPASWRAWLAAVTRRLALRTRRGEQTRRRHEHLATRPDDDGEQHAVERLQLHRRLTDAVLSLPEPYRTTITLRFFEDLSPRVIAAKTRVNSDVVRQRLHRGLTLLRQRLDHEFGGRRAWTSALATAGIASGASAVLLAGIAMNKLTVIASAVVVAAGVWTWSAAAPALVQPTAVPAAHAPAPAAAVTDESASAASEPVERELGVSAGDATCDVLVVDAAGEPVRDATVTCWSATDEFVERRTDNGGTCSFGAVLGAGGLLVCAAGHVPHAEALAERRGVHRLVLPAGESFSGTLLIDGVPAAAGWRLQVRGEASVGVDLPAPLARRIAERLAVLTDPAGTFALRGLPADWSGSLDLPPPLWLLPESGGTVANHQTMQVVAGNDPLRVATMQLPTVRFRFAWHDDGAPVAFPELTTVCSFGEGNDSVMWSMTGDENGTCVVGYVLGDGARSYARWCDPAQRPTIESVRGHVHANGCDGVQNLKFDRAQLAAAGNELVVPLPRATQAHFLVVDAAGQPIAGARVKANGTSEPTGTDGRGTFAGTARDVRRLGAPGHCIGPCPPRRAAAGTPDDPLVFELQPANSVQVRIVDAAGAAVPMNQLQVESRHALFAGRRMADEFDGLLGGTSAFGHGQADRGADGELVWRDCWTIVTAKARGTFVLHSLEPLAECVVTARDGLLQQVARQPLTTPAFGEHRELELVVAQAPRRLAGRVVDTNGNAIAGARVMVRGAGGSGGECSTRTPADGTFAIGGIYTDQPLDLSASAEGFVAHTQTSLTRDTETGDRLLRLAPGYVVTVRVVDEAGAPVAVEPRLSGTRAADEDLGPGAVRWRNLPGEVVEFSCKLGAETFSLRHDTRQPEARLRVPVPGHLTLKVPGGGPAQQGGYHVAIVHRVGTARPFEITQPGDAQSEPVVLVPGRYRIQLVERTHPEPQQASTRDRDLGLGAEVTVAANARVTAELR